MIFPDKTGPLCAKMDRGLSGQDGVNGMCVVLSTVGNTQCMSLGGVACTLSQRDYKSPNELIAENTGRKYIVRRLTPLECCRLQGFPDWWEDGVQGSDSERYRLWGNGMALPNMLYVMEGIKEALDGNK